jgi:predicted AAA+ superfamily ATPase
MSLLWVGESIAMISTEILQDQNPWWQDPSARRAQRFPVRRDLQSRLLARVQQIEDRRATVLLGPRQVGKTVLLFQVADDLLGAGWPSANLTYFDFSDDRLTEEVSAREVADALPVGADPELPRVLLFDEVHFAPGWDRWLKQAVDAGGTRIVVTDSAASVLRDGARESGQGRWDEIRIEGLTLPELARLQAGPEEDVAAVLRRLPNLAERYLALGGFPEHALSEDPSLVRARLRSDIVERAILRDLVRRDVDLARVRDLFVYLARDSGAVFDATARGRDLDADPRSVREWIRLLEETMLLASLELGTRRASTGLRARPRIYAADHGLVAAFASLPHQPGLRGRLFEAVVFRQLREIARASGLRLSYFRHSDDLELDFVLEGDAGIVCAIEVTSAARLREEKLERVRKAGAALGVDRLFLVHGGFVDEKAEGVRPIPLARFLMDASAVLEELP